ncbi:hypothetical protein, partial [Leuconostoc citreum]|uniref:hypothetical protein n=1 Tax=Leuconostoc citreum TaxID=33964 RepID=UPI0021A3B79E
SLSFHNKKLLYLIISDYALEIKQSGFSVYEHNLVTLTAYSVVMVLSILLTIQAIYRFYTLSH